MMNEGSRSTAAYETTLAEGLQASSAGCSTPCSPLEDQKEGMAAFAEKRQANFHNR
jgi:enoyl-CoA hydratase